MNKFLFAFVAILVSLNWNTNAQQTKQNKINTAQNNQTSSTIPLIRLNEKDNARDLAKAALKAHGGEKLKKIQNLFMRGSVEATPPNIPQTLPGSFAIVQAGEKSRLQIDLSGFGFIQVFDGQNTTSTLTAITLPPLSRYGLLMLGKIDEAGYSVTESKTKKTFTFSLVTPSNDVIDYVLDSQTGRVKSCFLTSNADGSQITTALEYTKFKEIDGVLLPEEFFQRIDFGQTSAYVKYKPKVILVNTKIDSDMFALKSQ